MKGPITVAKYDLEGNYLETLEATHMADLARQEGGVEQNTLTRAINNVTLTCNGFQYKVVDPHVRTPQRIGEVWHLVNRSGKNPEKIIGKYYKGKLVCAYRSMVEAQEKNDLELSSVSRVLSGDYSQTEGFTFKYLE